MAHPDVRFDVGAVAVLEVDRDEAAGNDVVAVLRELEVRVHVVQPRPERRDDLVVLHELRPEVRQLAPMILLGMRHDAELHRHNNATAWAARPSPRPVKPSLSVVVARTVTSSGST